MARKFGRENDEHHETEGMPEYEPAVHQATPEVPPDGELNYSKIVYGDQRFGDMEEIHDGFIEPGEEGMVGIKMQIENGAFGGHRRSEHIHKQAGDSVIGDERMPGDGHRGRDASGGSAEHSSKAEAGEIRHTKGRHIRGSKSRGGKGSERLP